MKLLGLLFFAAIVGGVGYLYVNEDTQEVAEFRTVKIERGDLIHAITATGTIEPVEVVDVGAQIVGRIKSFGPDLENPNKTIDFVSKVKKGSVIAQLDDVPYVAELERAQADLVLAKAEKLRVTEQEQQAARDLARAEQIRETASESEFEAARTAARVAEAEVAIAEAKVKQAEIALKQARINLDFATIRSPIDGIILDRRVNVGQTVVAGLNAPSLFLIAKDLSRMQVWAAVNEADIGQVHIGQSVSFSVDAYRDETFFGKVAQIRLNASTAHSVVTYGVIVEIENNDGKLLPYMTANLQFEVTKRSDVLLVPNQALRWKPSPQEVAPEFRDSHLVEATMSMEPGKMVVQVEKPTLWVQDTPGFVRPLEVEPGISDGVQTEIASAALEDNNAVVIGLVQKKKQDFVSSFVSRVTNQK